MDKPIKHTRTYFDYHECRDYLQEKYRYDERDYAGYHTNGKIDSSKPYQDFWVDVILNLAYNVGNETFFEMNDEWLDENCYDTEDWQRTIIEYYLSEFGEADSDGFRSINFWVEW